MDPGRKRPNRLREYRRAAELTQEKVADRLAEIAWEDHGLKISPGRELISQFERGVKHVSQLYRSLFCQLYGATSDDLGLRPARPQPQRAVSSEEELERRRFAKLSALALAGLVTGNVDAERLETILAGMRVDDRSVEDLEAMTSDLIQRSWSAAPQSLLPAVRGHLTGLRNLLGWTSIRLVPRVQTVAGETAMLAGHLAFKLDRPLEADRYWSVAEGFAELAGNRRLQAVVTALRAWRWGSEDRSRSVALLDGEVARLGPRPDPAVGALVLSWRATEAAYAANANAVEILSGLEAAERHLERLESRRDPLYTIENLGADMLGSRAWSFLALGRPADAVPVLEQLLHAMDPSWRGWRSMVMADLAVAHAKSGEPEEACVVLREAWRLAREAAMPHREQWVRYARQQLEGWDAPYVRQLDEFLREE